MRKDGHYRTVQVSVLPVPLDVTVFSAVDRDFSRTDPYLFLGAKETNREAQRAGEVVLMEF